MGTTALAIAADELADRCSCVLRAHLCRKPPYRQSIDPIDIPYSLPSPQVEPKRKRRGNFAALMRLVAALLALGSVIALLVGLVNADEHVQIGGRDCFILRGWRVIVSSVLMLLGTLGFISSYDEYGRFVGRRAVVPLLLISGAVAIWSRPSPSSAVSSSR